MLTTSSNCRSSQAASQGSLRRDSLLPQVRFGGNNDYSSESTSPVPDYLSMNPFLSLQPSAPMDRATLISLLDQALGIVLDTQEEEPPQGPNEQPTQREEAQE